MYKYTLTLFWLLFSLQLNAQHNQHQAWLDSMVKEDYIAQEIALDELVIEAETGKVSNQTQTITTEALMDTKASISLTKRGNYASEPILRGINSDRYTVSIDGMRVFSACTDKMDPVSSYIEQNNLASINVEHGNASFMQGSGTGGGIDFRLKKPFYIEQNVSALIGSRFQTVNNGIDFFSDVNVNKNNLAVRGSFTYKKGGDYYAGNRELVENSGYEKINYSLGVRYKLGGNSLLTFDYLGDDAWEIGYPALPMDVSSAKANMTSLSWLIFDQWKFSEIEVKTYYNEVVHIMDDSKRDNPIQMDMPGETNTFGMFVQGEIKTAKRQTWQVKLDYFYNRSYAEMTMNVEDEIPMYMETWPDVRRSALAGVLSWNGQLTPVDNLTLGSRVEHNYTKVASEFGQGQLEAIGKSSEARSNLLVNLNAQWGHQYTDWFKGSLSASLGQRQPNITEQYGFFLYNIGDGYDYIGDPDLKKEIAYQFNVEHRVGYDKFQLTTSQFVYLFQDYIIGVYDPDSSPMTVGAFGVKEYENIDEATMLGADLEMMYEFSEVVSVNTNVSYVYGQSSENDPLPLIPPLNARLSVPVKSKYGDIQPEVEWNGSQARVSESFNEISSDAYYLLNLRYSFEHPLGRSLIKVSIGIENILDQQYRSHTDIRRREFDGGITNIYRPGRNLYGQLSFKF
ncbi:MAG: TonB-dependent receptor [Reichenbachiella sp.]